MYSYSLILKIILIVIGAMAFTVYETTMILWCIMIVLMLSIWKKYNYSTARIVMFLFLLLISLCGNTNYLIFAAIVDFAITMFIVMAGDHVISKKWEIAAPWIIMVIIGTMGGFFFAKDQTSFHIGVEIYILLMLILLSSEFLYKKESIHWKSVFECLIVVNFGIIMLFFGNNTISDLLIKPRALIYLLGNSGVRSNTLGGIIVTFLVGIICFKKAYESTICKILIYLLIISDVLVLIFLQSRGCYIALVAVILVAIMEKIFVRKDFKPRDIYCLIGIIMLLAVMLCLLNDNNVLYKYVFARFFSNNSDVSNGRFELYQETVNMWLQHPLVGNGFLQFEAYKIENADPHNFIFGYLASCGILGTIAFLIFLWRVIRSEGSKSYNSAFRYMVIAQVVHGLFEPVLTTNLPLSLFIVICVLAVGSRRSKEVLDEQFKEGNC